MTHAVLIRRMIVILTLGLGCLLALPSVWAADDTAAAGNDEATRTHVLRAIEATRQADPALAAEMEQQLRRLDTGGGPLALTDKDVALGAPTELGGDTAKAPVAGNTGNVTGGRATGEGRERRWIDPPIDIGGGPTPTGDDHPTFKEVQGDPRMQELRRQVESGELTKDQALEKTFEVLKDHGVTPDNGREWEQGGREIGGGPNAERARERMAPEAREALERAYGHEGERAEGTRGSFERSHEVSNEGHARDEGQERAYERPTREFETREFTHEAPERTSEARDVTRDAPERTAPERTYEAPTHEREYTPPEPPREYTPPEPAPQ